MRVLLVDAYSSTDQLSEIFVELRKLVQEILSEQKELVDREEIRIFERTRTNLDDFLFEIDSSYVKKSAAKLFDHIDLVVIEGDVSLLPWFPQADKVNTLIRMCIRSKKLLFASGFAMQALVFLCASNLEKIVRVINGNGRGGKIGEALNFQKLGDLSPFSYFLDNVTGDFYAFNFDSQEWIPKVNAGMHYRRAAEMFDSIGKYVLKQPIYKPKPMIESPLSYLSKSNEEFCNIKKFYLGHWVFAGMQTEFKIPFKSHWDIHNFNFINELKTFAVLAETKHGPQILHLAPNCIATQFYITKKYPDTIQMFKNFIVHKLREAKSSQEENTTNIEKVSLQLKGSMAMFEIALNQHHMKVGNASANMRYTLLSKSKDNNVNVRTHTEATEIPHSGYAVKPRKEILTVKNNTVGINYAAQIQKLVDNWDTKAPKDLIIRQLVTSKASEMQDSNQSNRKMTPFRISRGVRDSHGQVHENAISEIESNEIRERLDSGELRVKKKKKKDMHEQLKGKAAIRRKLYPSISMEFLTEEDLWVPGYLSAKKKSYTPSRPRVRLDTTSSSRFYSRYNKDFKVFDHDPQIERQASLRCSSPYMTEEKRKILEEKDSNKKIIGPTRFKFLTKNSKPDFISNFVSGDFSEPVFKHKYRETSKDKWIAGEMRFF